MRSFFGVQRFRPTLWGVIVNRSFLSRYNLCKAIARHATAASGRLLDFGCGAKPYRSLLQVVSYTGVDIAVSGHDHANEEIDVYYDGKTLPFEAGSFDYILSSEVLEHVFNLEEILGELHRVLVPGGRLLISVPFAFPEHEAPYDFARYTRFALKNLLERQGFRLLSLEGTSSFGTTLCQLCIEFVANRLPPALPRWVRPVFQLSLAVPFSVLGLLCNLGYRGDGPFPLNYVILAEKT